MRNVLTFDVEDWHQSTFDPSLPITERVVGSTARILDLLAEREVHGTFFVLGLVAERFPDLARRIHAAGHEVASHGYSHLPVHAMHPESFRDDLRRSIALVQEATGAKVRGYRAPDFSITLSSLWALDVIAAEGLSYDSSLFPFAGPRYGIAAAPTRPFEVVCRSGARLVELPLATIEYLGVRLPAAGGGYFRLFPYAHSRAAIRRLNSRGSPATAYFHPYEIDDDELRSSPHRLPLRLRLSQGVGRSRVATRLRRLLRDFSWGPASQALDSPDLTAGRSLDLASAGAHHPVRSRESRV